MYQVFFLLMLMLGLGRINAQYNCQQNKFLHAQGVATAPINNNGKSDSLDVLHYQLELDMTSIHQAQLRGKATLSISPKIAGVVRVSLDLLILTVDSVLLNGSKLTTYTHSTTNPILGITLPNSFVVGDTFNLTVFYHGVPVTDQSGWGGFHFSNPYFYNLGVGFAANPHTFGRAWFPCFDNFVEKSTYTFAVKTSGGRKAYCNGLRTLLDTTNFGGDTVVSHWQQTDPIPTYLASVAISNYEEISYTHNSMPFLLLARSADTSNLKASFVNLPAIYDALVQGYGPYAWQKVGYALTTTGAMEHATSIHYPIALTNGTLASEDVIAHELAHHWFGNLVTCETAGDMWINEGAAEYLSHQYEEAVYSKERFKETVLSNQAYVIQYAAVNDGGHHALYDLPNELTYGEHTYQKGAMVMHNLRTYLGDTLFNGHKILFANYMYSTLNSNQYRDHLGPLTGYDLTSFFDDWVFNPGYPEFNIDSMRVIFSAIPEPTVKVGVSHRMRATTKRFSNVPLRISLRDSVGQVQHHDVLFFGNDTVYTLLNAFAPQWGNLNEDAFLLDATAYTDFRLKQPGVNANNRCKMDVAVTQIADSVNLRVEHHWTGPSRTGNEPFRISNSRYWRVTGHLKPGFKAEGRLEYSNSTSTGNLDADLVSVTEDSLILVYRKDATQPWQEFQWYSKNYFGAPNNGYGRVNIQVLIPGEYAFANGVSAFGLAEESKTENRIIAYPNPAGDSVTISFYPTQNLANWQVTDVNGRVLKSDTLSKNQSEIIIETAAWPAGTYVFTLEGESVTFMVN